MDDIPLIFDPVTGNYHRITPAAVKVLSFLDGTRTTEELIEFLSRHNPSRSEKVGKQVGSFLVTLEESGLLVGSQLPKKDAKKAAGGRFRGDMLMPRFVISKSLPKLLEPIASALRSGPLGLICGLFAAGAILGFAFAFHALFTSVPPITPKVGLAFACAGVIQIAIMFVHESAHALVAQVLKVPIRGLGVALLFYFMPLAYVDRTDAYRVRGRKGRVALALAGIMSDGWITGVAGLVAVNSDGLVQHVATYVVAMQMFGLVINLNPLFPSDGYSAIEASIGSVDTRGRAFTLLKSRVRRAELPAHLEHLSKRAKAAYTVYGLVSGAYVLGAAFSMLRGIATAVM
ncbi:hypothetical protein OG462_43595 [Streptomyces sp. NBC_01077]|uniref:PqqD family peptide modification chaperone n=1 Tax=Streptomyces sp. NBC_01077 TaxID=2903746 RepID=UPI00386FA36F|nr:hypothetical protein OG462_01410 [Streptomyces sp. NBC_01077]WSV43651.1 hypothetical protein OG462_43595 [Streptomyces sp. NBC_01077]